MRQLRQKLHSQSGASLIAALLFFLICTTVGAAIISSASANVDKAQGRRSEQQAYLSLSSAARLLQADLAGLTCVGEESTTVPGCAGLDAYFVNSPAHTQTYAVPAALRITDGGGDSQLRQEIADMAFRLYLARDSLFAAQVLGSTSQPTTAQLTRQLVLSAAAGSPEEIGTVYATLRMDADYKLTVTLSVDDPNAVDPTPLSESTYALTLTVQAAVTQLQQDSVQEDVCEHEYDSDPDQPYNRTEQRSYDWDVHAYTTTILWDGGQITKGVL